MAGAVLLAPTGARAEEGMDLDLAWEVIDGVYQVLEQDLRARGFGWVDVRIDPDRDESIGINTIHAQRTERLLVGYRITLGREVLGRAGISAIQLAQLACHEFGHLLGVGVDGLPVETLGRRISNDETAPEGEADFQSLILLRRVVAEHPRWLAGVHEGPRLAVARRVLAEAGVEEGRPLDRDARLLATAWRNLEEFLGARVTPGLPDEEPASRTLVDYPSPQVRLDSGLAGLLGRPRPRSWWAGDASIRPVTPAGLPCRGCVYPP